MCNARSLHPGNSDPLSEQTFVVGLINTLRQSPVWAETAVIISYDDNDGWYDHGTGPVIKTTQLDFLNGPGSCGMPAAGALRRVAVMARVCR